MYLKYHLKATDDKKKILEMFFKDWADSICNNKVRYSSTIESEDYLYGRGLPLPSPVITAIIKVEFDHEEDAVAMKLKGIPPDLQQYLSLI
jgi:hypothetical protein